MAQTTQTVSPVVVKKTKKADLSSSCIEAIKQAKKDANENIGLVLSVSDSLNYLSCVLLRLNDAMEKSIELDIKQTEKGGENETQI